MALRQAVESDVRIPGNCGGLPPLERPDGEGAVRPMTVIDHITSQVSRLFGRDDEGQGLAEYALILALIAIIAIIALIFLGGQVSKILSTVGSSV
jgi:pilus assembly protein Flp/PilA